MTNGMVEKVQRVFDECWFRVRGGEVPVSVCEGHSPVNVYPGDTSRQEWIWSAYMNSLDCTMVTREDLLESFCDMVNLGSAVKESVCLNDPCSAGDFILVPEGVVERALALGGLA